METGNAANYFNAAAGLLLIVTLAKIHTIHIHTGDRFRDLEWKGMTLSWIIGYTLWNWVFVYLNLGESSILHIAVLGSALIVGIMHKERWLEARAITLGTYFIIFHSFPHLNPLPDVTGYNNPAGLLMSLIALGFMVVYTIFFVRRKLKTRGSFDFHHLV